MSYSSLARRFVGASLAAASVWAVPQALAASLTENFNGAPVGWQTINTSDTPTGGWEQGNPSAARSFPAQAGAANSYYSSSFSATGAPSGIGDISNWLLTPALSFNNGDTLTFWTRAPSDFTNGIGPFPDRMQVRFSQGAGFDVGLNASQVGTFTQQLLDINPSLVSPPDPAAYPIAWTQYSYTFSGLSGATQGRIGFRHFVPQGGPDSLVSDYIGIDTVQITPVPEPSAYAMAAMGLIVLGVWSRRRRSNTHQA